MNKPIEIYFSANYKILYSDLDDFLALYQWNGTTKTWDYIDHMLICDFAENWIKDLVLNGKVALEEVKR
ncbi:MAG: hypothetical protein ABFC84_16835 [Veillonellales bacterium]